MIPKIGDKVRAKLHAGFDAGITKTMTGTVIEKDSEVIVLHVRGDMDPLALCRSVFRKVKPNAKGVYCVEAYHGGA